ncbi:methenyltetrahydrofolate synthase domain-containing protein isoform X2 [Episyrphus balteatus]|uniref:methenyltetrahydrofolate synthase domain-containing protein isoform X2 n=1 Tax=Episyrphus balteatus TaxID=286459 RepID=UPI002485B04E|nr:methenyltetrahydrofolate synthase domain-containing protein isoform X2 [Episyrphus balteatus]
MEEQKPIQNDTNNPEVPTTEEVTSTTPVVEVTKRSLRVQTWRKIQEQSAGVVVNGIFNRIPDFVDNQKAAELLAETPEFKKANKIKVNIDRALDSVKLQVLAAGKELYLPGTRESNALYLKVECPAEADAAERKAIIHVQDIQKSRTEILLENKVKFDLVVIGSCLVSRDGYRIGRGNGFADLDIGLLIEIGSITPDTVIATFVHDLQVVDNLPTNLFQKYDTPVDLIVTPTEVIRVAKPLPRPTGLFWEILSERRLKIIPVLQVLKENEEKAGKIITLKEENTDVESSANKNYQRRRRPYRPRARRSETQSERPRRKRQPGGRRPRSTKSKSEASAAEDNKEDAPQKQNKNKEQQSDKPRRRRQRQGKPVSPKERFCVKVTNIPKYIRVKDLKTELRKREVNPLYITWKGQLGKCYLHFPKLELSTEADDDVSSVLKSLSELQITAGEQNETCVLTTELIKFDAKAELAKHDEAVLESHSSQRIESVDTTTV